MKLQFKLLLAIAFLSLNAVAAPPKPSQSEYLLSTGGGFVISKDAGVLYAMNFRIIKDLPEGYVLKFAFENPDKKLPAITETELLEIDGAEIAVQSPALACIRNGKKYKVEVEIFSDETQTERLGRHKQKVEFSLPDELITQMDIKRC